MPNHPLLTVGIEMPADFPVKPYEAIYNRLASKQDTYFDSWYEFIRAWDAVAYRFRSCAEHDEAFAESIRRAGKGPPPPERYIQDRELFCFFVSGLATVECPCYGLFAIGSILDAQSFPFVTPDDKRNVSPDKASDPFWTTLFRQP